VPDGRKRGTMAFIHIVAIARHARKRACTAWGSLSIQAFSHRAGSSYGLRDCQSNRLRTPIYDVVTLSEGGEVQGSGAVAVDSRPLGRRQFDTLILYGGTDVPKASPDMITFVQAKQSRE
jgi:hypothetical protein